MGDNAVLSTAKFLWLWRTFRDGGDRRGEWCPGRAMRWHVRCGHVPQVPFAVPGLLLARPVVPQGGYSYACSSTASTRSASFSTSFVVISREASSSSLAKADGVG
jgi:hypothetical protein